jgi:exodeoxyribonuclease III
LKITTWNVNGLRAALNKGAWEWVRAHDPDVLCLQEIKVRPEQLLKEQHSLFEGFNVIWNPAQRPGYSGVASFFRKSPPPAAGNHEKPAFPEIMIGLKKPEFDLEGRLIASRHDDFWLFNVYFPSGQRDYGRVIYKLDFYTQLLLLCEEMHSAGEKIIICGDFNTAHREIDLRNPRQNQTTSGFLPEERQWVDRYLNNGFVDAFRQLYPDRVQYTWWTYRFGARQRNIGWRIDYFLVSEQLMPLVQDVIVHDEVLGSDHCPVTMLIAGAKDRLLGCF